MNITKITDTFTYDSLSIARILPVKQDIRDDLPDPTFPIIQLSFFLIT